MLDDLKEATKGGNHYYFGNVLLEKTGNKSDIIDGQQRVSTIIILVRAIYNVLEDRVKNGKSLNQNQVNSDEYFLKYLKEDFLIYRDKEKLQTIEYDRDYFKDLIIKNDDTKHNPLTPSQIRIKDAKEFFIKEFEKLQTEKILQIFEALKNANLLTIEFKTKKDSVLMFELQNNRGKDLTSMEKLKSYLAYQIYTYSKDVAQAETYLTDMTKIFEEIYRLINDIKTNEDTLLGYFNISRSNFDYRENDDNQNYKKELGGIYDNDKKIDWIMGYVRELKNAFVNFKEFEKLDSNYAKWLRELKVDSMYPFIIKAYKIFGGDKDKIDKVCQLLEIIAFRHKLVKTGADLRTRLNKVLKEFDNIQSLENGLKNICSNKVWYWRDEDVSNKLVNIFLTDEKKNIIIPYIFQHYENELAKNSAITKGYVFDVSNIEGIQRDHIAPQAENGEKVASGYCEYDDEFMKSYLHCIGNLVLISGPHNGANGNKPFETKLESFKNSPLIQQREIKDFASGNKWDKEAIRKRHAKIEKFVLERWSYK